MGNVCFGRNNGQDDETPLQNTPPPESSTSSESGRSSRRHSRQSSSASISNNNTEYNQSSSSIPEPPPPYAAAGSAVNDGVFENPTGGLYSRTTGNNIGSERGQSSSTAGADETFTTTTVNEPMDLTTMKKRELDQIQMAKRVSLLHHIPTDSYHNGDGKFDSECPICMIDFEEGEQIRSLPCLHTFHLACIDDWLLRSFTCPSCMEPVDAALLADYASKLTDFISDVNLSSLSSSPATVFLPKTSSFNNAGPSSSDSASSPSTTTTEAAATTTTTTAEMYALSAPNHKTEQQQTSKGKTAEPTSHHLNRGEAQPEPPPEILFSSPPSSAASDPQQQPQQQSSENLSDPATTATPNPSNLVI